MKITQSLSKFAGKSAVYLLTLTLFLISANAATFVVTKTADTNDGICDADCSLREAVTAANTATTDDLIQFDQAVFSTAQTITLSGSQLEIMNNGTLTINAPGAEILAVSGNNQSRVFIVNSGATAVISGMTIKNGNGTGNNLFGGGGIYCLGNLSLDEVVVSHNIYTAPFTNSNFGGGGIFNNGGTMTINNSRIEYNQSLRGQIFNSVAAGGILNRNGANMTITASSITDNIGEGNGGGINNGGGTTTAATLTIINSTVSNNAALTDNVGIGGGIINYGTINADHITVAGNTARESTAGINSGNQDGTVFNSRNSIYADNFSYFRNPTDFVGTLTSGGYNLIGNTNRTIITGDTTGNILNQSPKLRPLSLHGGFTKYQLLAISSPALDKGSSFMTLTDQRGLTRPFDFSSVANAADGADIGAVEVQVSELANRTELDFDGDSKTDVGIYRPSANEWWIKHSSSDQTFAIQFGQTNSTIVPADYTADGKTDIAFWSKTTGYWYIIRSEDSTYYAFPFGSPGDIPVPGDYDGDYKADAAVFRPSNATWYIKRSSDNINTIQQFGVMEDKPVVADYDGDGKTDIAVYRPTTSEWWILNSTTGNVAAVQFGQTDDKTVQGDYTGDGKADIAFWRPSNGNWYILRSDDSSFYAFPFGSNGDVPAPGDYDGDGKTDAAVFRLTNSTWYLQRSTSGFGAVQFGTDGDQPIPNAFVRN